MEIIVIFVALFFGVGGYHLGATVTKEREVEREKREAKLRSMPIYAQLDKKYNIK